MNEAARRRLDAVLLVVGAGAAFATSGPLARFARPLHPLAIACGRVALASLVLALAHRGELGRVLRSMGARQRRGIVLAGTILAAHFALFVWGLECTSLPAAVSLVSLEPLSVVLLAWLLHGIAPRRLELAGVAVATVGAAWISRAAGSGEHRLLGDVLVLGAVVLYGLYISAARAFRGTLSAGSYAAIVYGVAGVVSGVALALAPARAGSVVWPMPAHAAGAVVALALVPTLIGHTAVQAAARTSSPSTVAMVSQIETIGGLAIGAAWLGALPTGTELAGAALILVGVTLGILGAR
jgi:drug/metabolite transporter (DMT)-like permease